MRFDFVHDTQRIFRKLLDATAYPGTIVDVSVESAGIDLGCRINPAVVALSVALLDAETSFHLWPEDAADAQRLLAQLTYGRVAAAEDARFLIVLPTGDVREALRRASRGTLEEPHLGATVTIGVETLGPAGPLRMEGPGIQTRTGLAVSGIDPAWVGAREEKCREYPIGVDVILVDERRRLVSIPRTTRLWEEA